MQLLTFTPPTLTVLSFATGVRTPVLPTWKSIFSISVKTSSAGNLCAIAHLGDLAISPSCFCKDISLTLKTTPSISNGILSLEDSIFENTYDTLLLRRLTDLNCSGNPQEEKL